MSLDFIPFISFIHSFNFIHFTHPILSFQVRLMPFGLLNFIFSHPLNDSFIHFSYFSHWFLHSCHALFNFLHSLSCSLFHFIPTLSFIYSFHSFFHLYHSVIHSFISCPFNFGFHFSPFPFSQSFISLYSFNPSISFMSSTHSVPFHSNPF